MIGNDRTGDTQINAVALTASIMAVMMIIIIAFFVLIIVIMCLFLQYKTQNTMKMQIAASNPCYKPNWESNNDLQT